MIALEVLIQLNNHQATRRDNFNRDSSCVASRGGFVIHSGIHRSTAYVHPDEHPDSFFSLQYWNKQEQEALNAWIETIIDGGTVAQAEAEAFKRSRPAWEVRQVKPKQAFAGGGELIASTGGKLPTIAAANTWRHLHARTKGGGK